MPHLLRMYIIYTTIKDVPVALFLTSNRVCEVLTSQNQSVQLRLIMYTSAQPLPIGAFGMSINIAKIRLLHDNVSCFDDKFIGMKQNTSIAH